MNHLIQQLFLLLTILLYLLRLPVVLVLEVLDEFRWAFRYIQVVNVGECHHFIHAFDEAVAQWLLRLVQDGLALLAVVHSVLCSTLTLAVLLAIKIPQVFRLTLFVGQFGIFKLLG